MEKYEFRCFVDDYVCKSDGWGWFLDLFWVLYYLLLLIG